MKKSQLGTLTEKEAVGLLKKHIPEDYVFKRVLKHSKIVQRLAVDLAKKAGLDVEFVRIAALLHDIGRYGCRPGSKESILHGIRGAEILRKEGYEDYARVAENHIGIGITKEDIEKNDLPLPKKDYVPKKPEDMIICYADNLVKDDKLTDEGFVLDRFTREFGKGYGQRVKGFHRKVHRILKN